jgi:hypothetical protein
MDLEQLFIDNKEQSITGRYLPRINRTDITTIKHG